MPEYLANGLLGVLLLPEYGCQIERGKTFFLKSWAVGENIIIEVVALHQGPEGTNRPSQP